MRKKTTTDRNLEENLSSNSEEEEIQIIIFEAEQQQQQHQQQQQQHQQQQQQQQQPQQQQPRPRPRTSNHNHRSTHSHPPTEHHHPSLIPIHRLSIHEFNPTTTHHLDNDHQSTQPRLCFSSSNPLHHPSRSIIFLQVHPILGLQFKSHSSINSSLPSSNIPFSTLLSIQPSRVIQISVNKTFRLLSNHSSSLPIDLNGGSLQNQELIEYHLKIIYDHLNHHHPNCSSSHQFNPPALPSNSSPSTAFNTTPSKHLINQDDVIVISSDDDNDNDDDDHHPRRYQPSKLNKTLEPRNSRNRPIILHSSDEHIKLEDNSPDLQPSQELDSNRPTTLDAPPTRREIFCQFDLSAQSHQALNDPRSIENSKLNHQLLVAPIQLKGDPDHDPGSIPVDPPHPSASTILQIESSFKDFNQFILYLHRDPHPITSHRSPSIIEPHQADHHELKIEDTEAHGSRKSDGLQHANQGVSPRLENQGDHPSSPHQASEVPSDHRLQVGPRAESLEVDDHQVRTSPPENDHNRRDGYLNHLPTEEGDRAQDQPGRQDELGIDQLIEAVDHQPPVIKEHENRSDQLTGEGVTKDEDRVAQNQSGAEEDDRHQSIMADDDVDPIELGMVHLMRGSDRVYDRLLVDDNDDPNRQSTHTAHGAHTALVGSDESMEDIDRVQDQRTSHPGDRDKPRTEQSITYDAHQTQDRKVHDRDELVAWQETTEEYDRVQVRTKLDDHDGRFKPEPEIDELMVECSMDRNQEHRSVVKLTEDDLRERLSPSCSPIDEYLGFPSQSQRRISSIASSSEDDEPLGFESEEEHGNEPSLDDFMRFLNQQQTVLNAAASTTTTPPPPPPPQATIPPVADHLDRDDHRVLASTRSLQSVKITPSSLPERLGEGGVSRDDSLTTELHPGGILPDREALEETARLDFFNASDAFQSHLIDSQPLMDFNDFALSNPMDPDPIDIPVPSLLETNPSERPTEGSAHALPQSTSTRDTQDHDETMLDDVPVRQNSPIGHPSHEREEPLVQGETQTSRPVDPTDFGEVESDPEDETYDPKVDDLRTKDGSMVDSSASDDDDLEARAEWEEDSDGSSVGVPAIMKDDHLDRSRLGYHEVSLRYAGLMDYLKEFKQKSRLKIKSLKMKNKIYRRGYLKKSSALKLLRSRLKLRDDRILELELDYKSSLEDLHRAFDDLKRSQVSRALESTRASLMASKYQIAILIEKLKLFELIKTDLESENHRLKQRITSLEASMISPFNLHYPRQPN